MNTTIYKFGFWSGLIVFGATTAFVIAQSFKSKYGATNQYQDFDELKRKIYYR